MKRKKMTEKEIKALLREAAKDDCSLSRRYYILEQLEYVARRNGFTDSDSEFVVAMLAYKEVIHIHSHLTGLLPQFVHICCPQRVKRKKQSAHQEKRKLWTLHPN